ncbi:transcriptional regulator BetI [Marinospirillum minutulum]|uniref:transcriptional regulator BetI n=1 Tax=Marinospirillum minutulum TaxID=64974 RepID=UPI00040CCCC8|nr:transcriptional regulator BetI [Marinospirillum minutulum]
MPKVGMPEIRKSQLIQATIEAINDVGLHKASVAMIGRYAGVSPSIINHYFGGKDSLLEETMRSILKDLSAAITYRLAKVSKKDVPARIIAIVEGNFDPKQLDSKVVKTWLTFWSHAMHMPPLHRLQRINEQRLLSYLRYELKQVVEHQEANFIAQGVAALIDGIWLRGALSPEGINKNLAEQLILDYLQHRLPSQVFENHRANQTTGHSL